MRTSFRQAEPGGADECNSAKHCLFVCIRMHFLSHILNTHVNIERDYLHLRIFRGSPFAQRISTHRGSVAFKLICTDTFCPALLLTEFFLLKLQGQASLPE